MEHFGGRLAVVTGGGSGIGRELVLALADEGCAVATCDVRSEALVETAALVADRAPAVRVTTHLCDVADEESVRAFRDAVVADHATDHADLLFNNAGIAGGGSFLRAPREEWDRTFAIDWLGVYHCCRAFVPLLVAAPEAALVNTSSVNGLWASLGPGTAHTAYSTAKFAVRGFTESLIGDFALHAPHVSVHLVMPGHIGTGIIENSRIVRGGSPVAEMTAAEVATTRTEFERLGFPVGHLDDDRIRAMLAGAGDHFRHNAPMSAAEAAAVILDGVRAGRWRILVGADARALDERVRADPEGVYGPDGPALRSVVPG